MHTVRDRPVPGGTGGVPGGLLQPERALLLVGCEGTGNAADQPGGAASHRGPADGHEERRGFLLGAVGPSNRASVKQPLVIQGILFPFVCTYIFLPIFSIVCVWGDQGAGVPPALMEKGGRGETGFGGTVSSDFTVCADTFPGFTTIWF